VLAEGPRDPPLRLARRLDSLGGPPLRVDRRIPSSGTRRSTRPRHEVQPHHVEHQFREKAQSPLPTMLVSGQSRRPPHLRKSALDT
jgi:hypothetical protein